MYNFSVSNQSPWLVDVYNEFLEYKTDGFLVEIGVGHTLAGLNYIFEDTLESLTSFERIGNNTADLLDIGWSGIYIEPVYELCEEAKIAHKNNLDRLQIVNVGASNVDEDLPFFINDTFIPNDYDARGYPWVGRVMKLQKAVDILDRCNCPNEFDIMSIDVEGWELKVLDGLDFNKHCPKLLVIETCNVGIESINNALPDFYKFIRNDYLNGVWIDHRKI